MINDLLYVENICAFPHILGSPPHIQYDPIPSEFPYILYEDNFVLFFISVSYYLLGLLGR
jgi:hypothetical protein